jgi:hypothetical protein
LEERPQKAVLDGLQNFSGGYFSSQPNDRVAAISAYFLNPVEESSKMKSYWQQPLVCGESCMGGHGIVP